MALSLPTAIAAADAGVYFTARAISTANKKIRSSLSCVRSCIRAHLLLPVLPLSSTRCRLFSSTSAALSDDHSEEEHPSDSNEAGRLYIGNLPFTTTTSELAQIFGQAGKVNSVEIIYDRLTNRSRGFGFVTMATVEEANEAIRMYDGAQVGGRVVKVNFPEVPRGGEREALVPRTSASTPGYVETPYKIYAGNLRWTVTSEALAEAFSACSGVLGAKVVYERGSSRSKGFGFVAFASAEESRAALEAMNGKPVAGRPLRLNHATARASPAPTSTATATAPPGGLGEEAVLNSSSLESSVV